MDIQVNRPVTLGSQTLGKGQHSIDVSDVAGWFFDALVKEGAIVILRETVEAVKEVVEAVEDLVDGEEVKPKRKGK